MTTPTKPTNQPTKPPTTEEIMLNPEQIQMLQALLQKTGPEGLQQILDGLNDNTTTGLIAASCVVDKLEGEVVVDEITLPVTTELALIDEDGETFSLSRREELALREHTRREAHRRENYRRSEALMVYEFNGRVRTRLNLSTSLVGLIPHMAERGLLGVDGPSVLHILNEVKDDDRKVPLSADFRNAVVEPVEGSINFSMVKEKHLINVKLFKALAYTFPTAAGFRAYVSGLCAPGQYVSGLEITFCEPKAPKTVVNDKHELVPCADEDGNLIMVDIRADGNGTVHPHHWLCQKLNLSEAGASFQIRFWDPSIGLFCKGILVVDDSAVDEEGKPLVLVNRSFVKGRLKKARLDDRYTVSGTVINVWTRPHFKDLSRWSFELLQQLYVRPETVAGLKATIDHAFAEFKRRGGMERYVRQAASQDSIIDMTVQVCKKINGLIEAGELEGELVDPLSVRDVANVAFIHAERDFYTLLQGAGLKSPTYTLFLDDSMPDYATSRCGMVGPAIAIDAQKHIEKTTITVKAAANGEAPEWKEFVSNTRDMDQEWLDANPGAANLNGRVSKLPLREWKRRIAKLNPEVELDEKGAPVLVVGMELLVEQIDDVYLPGDIVLMPRYPLVTQQNFLFGVVVKPFNGVLKATGRLAARTYRASEKTIAAFMMGDADGDRGMVEGRERILSWAKPEFKVRNVHGGKEVACMLEPSKADAENDPIAKIRMLNEKQTAINARALELIGHEGGGPVGELTYMHAVFMQLAVGAESSGDADAEFTFLCDALAVAIMIQEAIDRMKRSSPYTNPLFSKNPDNWVLVAKDTYELPKDTPRRFIPANWYEGHGLHKDINMKLVRKWAYEEIEEVYEELKLLRKEVKTKYGTKKVRAWNFKDIMSWRKMATGDKRLDPRRWEVHTPIAGGDNLVTIGAAYASEVWFKEFGLEISDLQPSNLLDLIASALEATGHKVSWEPVDFKTSKVLRAKTGLKGYNQDLKDAMSLEYEARAEARLNAEAKMVAAISACTLQEVTTAIVMELENAKQNELERTMNNIFRLVACAGSPFLTALDLQEGGPCRYMSEETGRQVETKRGSYRNLTRAEVVVPWLAKQKEARQASGEVVTLGQLAMEVTGRISAPPAVLEGWSAIGVHTDIDEDKPSKHMVATGMPMRKCQHCCRVLDAEVRKFETNDRNMANRDMVTRRISVVNKRLGGNYDNNWHWQK